MEPIRISRDEARLLAVIGQKLDRRPRGKANKTRVMEMIEHLGCVQLDTISVVARSHETVLWSRLGAFDPSIVWKLYKDRKLFEYWTHAAAITPLHMFPYFRVTMDRFRGGDVGVWLDQNQDTASHVLTQIEAGGPQQSRSFEAPEDSNPTPWEWYGGKPAKQALDYLWCIGDLTVVNRQGFQRLYDLTERSVPEDLRLFVPTPEERRRFFTQKSLSAMGIAKARWTSDYFRGGVRGHVNAKGSAEELDLMAEEGLAHRVDVEGWEEPAWLDPGMLTKLEDLRAGRGKPVLTTLLSPFDSLVWHRGRNVDLFNFEYRIEVYTPEAKRTYGYYSLPILHRGRIIGRIDLHYARKAKMMTIRSAHLEPKVKANERIAAAIVGAVMDYMQFLGGGDLVLGATANPPELGPLLAEAIRGDCQSVEATSETHDEAAIA